MSNVIAKYDKPKKSKVSLTLDNDLLDVLKVLSGVDDRSLSSFVNKQLRKDFMSKSLDEYTDLLTGKPLNKVADRD